MSSGSQTRQHSLNRKSLGLFIKHVPAGLPKVLTGCVKDGWVVWNNAFSPQSAAKKLLKQNYTLKVESGRAAQ